MRPPTIDHIINVMQSKDYAVFAQTQKTDLNIVGIRTNDMDADTFNDWMQVFWYSPTGWNLIQTPCTTDPGLYYRENPVNVRGTALMVPGQYRGVYQIGKHKGQYDCLKQVKAIDFVRLFPGVTMDQTRRTVIGDNKLGGKSIILTDTNNQIYSHRIEPELIGANVHRASTTRLSTQVGRWSAGCQVIPDLCMFEAIMGAARQQVRDGVGATYTYTLLTEGDFI